MNVNLEHLLQVIGKQAVMIDCLETQLKEAHAQLNARGSKDPTPAQAPAET